MGRAQPGETRELAECQTPERGGRYQHEGRRCTVRHVSFDSCIVDYDDGKNGVVAMNDLRPLEEDCQPEAAYVPSWAAPEAVSKLALKPEVSVASSVPLEVTAPDKHAEAPVAPIPMAAPRPSGLVSCPVAGCKYQALRLSAHFAGKHPGYAAAKREAKGQRQRGEPQEVQAVRLEQGPQNAALNGTLRMNIDITIQASELCGWSADRMAALFSGLAQVLAAQNALAGEVRHDP